MAYWLIKTEPETWSWNQQVKKGAKGEPWTGVRNFQARTHLQAMKKGDRVLFYHTGDEKRVVGIAEIIRAAYADPTDETGKFVCVDVKAVEALKQPVTLESIKAEAKLEDMVLVRNSRLSVQPVTDSEWRLVLKLGGMK
jgi:predicted RNA-binding protein with PUA-like domain